jgi:gliding motility-associated lipoprotein GldH
MFCFFLLQKQISKIGLSTIILVLLYSLSSCDSNRIYQKYEKIDNYIWQHNEEIEFKFDVEDTISNHLLYVQIRHSSNYPYSNLWLEITSQSPTGITSKDSLECIFADKTGKWLGDGAGDIWDNQILWKKLVRFPQQGTYSIKYRHLMRLKNLPGILDVGFRIDKIDNKE